MSGKRGVLIGAGFFAGFQAASWRRMAGAGLEAVADLDAARAQQFASAHGIPRFYTNAREMIETEKPDFVDIATRPDSHLELTELCASLGCHVICQKPMAPSMAECEAMVSVCRDRGVRLIVHENWRFQPWYRELKRLLEADRLGRVFYLSFLMRNGDGIGPTAYSVQPYFKEMPRFLLYETGIHFIDTFRYLAGEMEEVRCLLGRVNREIAGEDMALVTFRFAGGAIGLFDANRISGPNPPAAAFGWMRLEGERAMARLEPDGRIFLQDHGQPEAEHLYAIPREGYRGDSVHAAQAHYVDALSHGFAAETEAADYLRSVAAMFACYRSAETGRPVPLALGEGNA